MSANQQWVIDIEKRITEIQSDLRFIRENLPLDTLHRLEDVPELEKDIDDIHDEISRLQAQTKFNRWAIGFLLTVIGGVITTLIGAK